MKAKLHYITHKVAVAYTVIGLLAGLFVGHNLTGPPPKSATTKTVSAKIQNPPALQVALGKPQQTIAGKTLNTNLIGYQCAVWNFSTNVTGGVQHSWSTFSCTN